MKAIKRRIIRLLLVVALGVSGSLAGCSDDINNYEKELGSEASNKVFFSESMLRCISRLSGQWKELLLIWIR